VTVIDAYAEPERFERLLLERLAAPELSVIVARRPCILAAADIRKWEQQAAEFRAAGPGDLRSRFDRQSSVCEPAEVDR
jgi:indolepyruvate ferredoxin oxidoreductase alpha subunit